MRLQTVGHDWATELSFTSHLKGSQHCLLIGYTQYKIKKVFKKKKEGKRHKQEIEEILKTKEHMMIHSKITVINFCQPGKFRKLDDAKCFWDAEDIDIGVAIL